ncbi:Glycosyl transferases group 1 [compost metagenome]
MSKRPVIGIPFNYDESWIGGTYYIKNLVSALGLIDAKRRPDVWVISHSEKSFEFIKNTTGYSRLNWIRPELISGADGGISRKARLLSWLVPGFKKKKVSFDVIFPYPIDSKLQQTVCWIPDFQDKRLPEFFSEAELTVVQFATFEPPVLSDDQAEVLSRYELPERYFYCPNQFWIHKNHKLVIEAVYQLKQQGISVVVAFSGKEHDHRAPDHTQQLKDLVARYDLTENIRFLGFIPRADQMVVFQRATCVLQPSLFEGWSTVIEDAKSLSQYVLAADIPANVEQTKDNIEFFNPREATELAGLLKKYASIDPLRVPVDYSAFQRQFAESFMGVVAAVMANSAAAPGESSERGRN